MGLLKYPFSTPLTASTAKVTQEQADALFSREDVKAGASRGRLKTTGQWQLPVSFTALATTQLFHGENGALRKNAGLLVFGVRTLSRVHQSGYALEGRISVLGKSFRGFTSSQLFELPDGRLLSADTIHVCMDVDDKLHLMDELSATAV